jgi:hypothetical protein
MPSTIPKALRWLVLLAVVAALPTVLAHGGDDEGAMDMDMGEQGDMGAEDPKPDPGSYPPTYFAHPEHVAAIYTHIGIMVMGWVFMLPAGMRLGSRLVWEK